MIQARLFHAIQINFMFLLLFDNL